MSVETIYQKIYVQGTRKKTASRELVIMTSRACLLGAEIASVSQQRNILNFYQLICANTLKHIN